MAGHEGLRARLGPDHVLALAGATNLANNLAAGGDHEAAFASDSATTERAGRVLGTEHPSTLACSVNLALDLIALGRETEGRQRLETVLPAYRRVLGDYHPAVVAALAAERADWDVDPMPL